MELWITFQRLVNILKGAGGVPGGQMVKMGFLILFLIKASEHFQMLFTAWKNIVPSPSYHASKIGIYIQLHYAREL